MRKRIIENETQPASTDDRAWLDLERLAQVEVTSERAEHPVEAALIPNAGAGWRAGQSGKQAIRLLFDRPQRVTLVHLVFQEGERERTQEFSLRWSGDSGTTFREIARQQFNFSPPSTTVEIEDYAVDLDAVTILELTVTPDISRGEACASLQALRIA
jgi:hypothetical protein